MARQLRCVQVGESPEAREVQGEAESLVFTLKPSPPQLLGSRDFTYSHPFIPLGILYLLHFLSLLFNLKKVISALFTCSEILKGGLYLPALLSLASR